MTVLPCCGAQLPSGAHGSCRPMPYPRNASAYGKLISSHIHNLIEKEAKLPLKLSALAANNKELSQNMLD